MLYCYTITEVLGSYTGVEPRRRNSELRYTSIGPIGKNKKIHDITYCCWAGKVLQLRLEDSRGKVQQLKPFTRSRLGNLFSRYTSLLTALLDASLTAGHKVFSLQHAIPNAFSLCLFSFLFLCFASWQYECSLGRSLKMQHASLDRETDGQR